MEKISTSPTLISQKIEQFSFRSALHTMMNLARWGNKYLAEQEPWKEIKTNPNRVTTILNIALQITAALSVLSEPFLPFTAKKLKKLLNIQDNTIEWKTIAKNKKLIKEGHSINKPQLLFQKIENETIQKQIEKLKKNKKK